MATTTIDSILDQWVTLIEALTPSLVAATKFRNVKKQQYVREWATQNAGSALFRAFDVSQTSPMVEHRFVHPDQVQRTVQLTVTVAYPKLPGIYGEGVQDMEKLIHADTIQIRDKLFSSTNYLAGQQAALPDDIAPPDRDETVWFQQISFSVIYDEAQTL